jgi:transmembrane sensor
MDTPEEDLLLQEAAGWYARLAAPDCSAAERRQFHLWRESSPLHVEACARLQHTVDVLDRLASRDPRPIALSDRAYAMGRAAGSDELSQRRHRRWAVPATLAASLVMVLVGLRMGSQLIWPPSHRLAYENTSVQQRRISLEDGSVVHMDVNSRITVLISTKQRQIELLAGRVLFEVTHDPKRPFSVIAGNARTTDLGTRFQVDRTREGVVVTLEEGSVVVDSALSERWREQLSPGEQLSVSSNAASRVRRAVDPFAATSWSRGRLVFRATPLVQAVEEVNRYTAKKLRVGDPSLAELTVSGNVVAGNCALAASAFAAVLPIHVVDSGGEAILVPARADGSP